MLDEEKIRQMTGIAMFSKKEGRMIFPVNRRFRSDYLSLHLIVSFFTYSICCCICFLAWILCKNEELFSITELGDIGWILFLAGIIYLAGLFLFLFATWMIYQKRYDIAGRGMDVYVAKLKKLRKLYDSAAYSQEDY